MDKKKRMLHIITTFEEQVADIPNSLQDKLTTVKKELEHLTGEEVERLSGAVTSPASEQEFNQDPVSLLFEAYSEMEKMVLSGEHKEEAERIISQLRGLYDIPDRYFP